MAYTTLIDADTLRHHLTAANAPGGAEWVVVDCRFDLFDPDAGRRDYARGHIPGARYAHLAADLSGPVTPTSGRHPLPAPEALAATLSAWGIANATQVVAYDHGPGAMAARLWWLLRWLGHERCAVLDGGWHHWQQQGLPMSQEAPIPQRQPFNPRPARQRWLDSLQVLYLSEAEKLLDARAQTRFNGEQEPIDPVAGHIPRALNAPFEANLEADGRWRSREALQARFAALLDGTDPAQTVHMCGSGVTACHNLLAMEHAGLTGSLLYPGSWSEWIRDPARPIATSTPP